MSEKANYKAVKAQFAQKEKLICKHLISAKIIASENMSNKFQLENQTLILYEVCSVSFLVCTTLSTDKK